MTRHFIRRGMLAALPSLSLATYGLACTVLMLKDARGNRYQGRTNEYPGMQAG